MAGENTAVFGIYSSGEHAERAVDTLIAAGFASTGDEKMIIGRKAKSIAGEGHVVDEMKVAPAK
jgi:hypothetical protein